jgi:hypothetical protein
MLPHIARRVVVLRLALLPLSLPLSLPLATGCKEDIPAVKPCCDQPEIPAGVLPFQIVADEVVGPSDAEKVVLRAVLSQPPERQQIYPVLHTLFRFAMTRGAFEPIDFKAEVYDSKAAADRGQGAVATMERGQTNRAPACENVVPWTFEQTVERAYQASLGRAEEEDVADTCHMAEKKVVARVDDGFKNRPQLSVDPAAKSAEVTYPFLELGKDEFAANLKLNSAFSYWIEFTTSMFRRAPDLARFSFVGIHDGEPVLKVAMTRAEFGGGFSTLQEDIAAHAALTFQKLGMNMASDKAAEKEQDTFRTKTYKTALGTLPRGQVMIARHLK